MLYAQEAWVQAFRPSMHTCTHVLQHATYLLLPTWQQQQKSRIRLVLFCDRFYTLRQTPAAKRFCSSLRACIRAETALRPLSYQSAQLWWEQHPAVFHATPTPSAFARGLCLSKRLSAARSAEGFYARVICCTLLPTICHCPPSYNTVNLPWAMITRSSGRNPSTCKSAGIAKAVCGTHRACRCAARRRAEETPLDFL
eukprot:366485-Chlamydomonas_euryale.AAC.20